MSTEDLTKAQRMCDWLNEHGNFPFTIAQLEAAAQYAESKP